MGDYTPMEIVIYDCPPEKARDVLIVLDDHGASPGWFGSSPGDELELTTSYGVDEARGDESEEVIGKLRELGVTAAAWTSPKYEWLGSYTAYHPDLGYYQADCDDQGVPQFTAENLTKFMAKHRDMTVGAFLDEVMPKVTGEVWREKFAELMDANAGKVLKPLPEDEED